MHIKTTLEFHLIPVRMATIKKSNDSKCWCLHGEKEPAFTVGGSENWAHNENWKSLGRFPQNSKNRTPRDPARPLLGISAEDTTSYCRDICSHMFTAGSSQKAKKQNQPRRPSPHPRAAKHLDKCLMDICISSLEKSAQGHDPFLIGFFVFLTSNFLSSLYILDTNPLSGAQQAPPSVNRLSASFNVYFTVQKLLVSWSPLCQLLTLPPEKLESS